MLVLPTLHTYLSQLLSPPSIHTALLLTPEGALTRTGPAPQRSKDEIRMAAGLGAEVWAETRGEGEGMAESELGRILVLAVEDGRVSGEGTEPLLLLAVNGTLEANWDTMRVKACCDFAFATPPSASSHARTSPLSSSGKVDPHALLKAEISHVRSSLLNLLGSSNPTLSEIASYYFHHPSKQLRPLLVLLFSRATNGLGSQFPLKLWSAEHARLSPEQLNAPLSRPDVLNDFNPSMPDHTTSFNSPFDLRPPPTVTYPSPPPSLCVESAVSLPQLAHTLLPSQLRLAQIVEMIHVASLLHDDVIDKSDLRRGAPSAPAAFGNKLAVLGGDFLLGRASAALSRLGDNEVVELISTVIANLVEGEILQMKGTGARSSVDSSAFGEVDLSSLHAQPSHAEVPDRWCIYLKKTYLKTASLMAKGARAAVVLGGCREGEVWKEVAYAYGRNVGIAFQLVDDILDFSSSSALGKPGSGADLRLGLATGPVLYAAEEYPELEPLIARGFKHDGDVERALSLIHASSGVSRTRDLAQAYAEKAREVLAVLPASEAREALEALTEGVVRRGW
ncbi:terpenoid synthase [Imleria badia]|nr:terpenoid synthase [Imleria badia]